MAFCNSWHVTEDKYNQVHNTKGKGSPPRYFRSLHPTHPEIHCINLANQLGHLLPGSRIISAEMKILGPTLPAAPPGVSVTPQYSCSKLEQMEFCLLQLQL